MSAKCQLFTAVDAEIPENNEDIIRTLNSLSVKRKRKKANTDFHVVLAIGISDYGKTQLNT